MTDKENGRIETYRLLVALLIPLVLGGVAFGVVKSESHANRRDIDRIGSSLERIETKIDEMNAVLSEHMGAGQ